MHQTHMIIDGEQLPISSHKVETIYNPANQEPVALVSVGTSQEAGRLWRRQKRHFLCV